MSKVAAIQMASGLQVQGNLLEAGRLITAAVDAGAELVVLPENFALMGATEQDKVKQREAPGEGPIQAFLAEQARTHGIWLVGGTVPLAATVPDKIHAACLVFNPQGEQVARYDKIHLFDVNIPQSNERYEESATIEPGKSGVTLDTPWGRLGLAVCYDLRFPELFRLLLEQGAEFIALPAAFTAVTGKAHWECLLRARAIENMMYIIAAAQGGFHLNGRETYGDSLIVDPWGNVLERRMRGNGVVAAELDADFQANTRSRFPAIQHRRIVCGHNLS